MLRNTVKHIISFVLIMLLCVQAHSQTRANPQLQYFDLFKDIEIRYMPQFGLYHMPQDRPHMCLYSLAQSPPGNWQFHIDTAKIIAVAYGDSSFLINIDGQQLSLKMKPGLSEDLTAKTNKYRIRLYSSYYTKGVTAEFVIDRFVITNIVTGLKTVGKLYTQCY